MVINKTFIKGRLYQLDIDKPFMNSNHYYSQLKQLTSYEEIRKAGLKIKKNI